MAVTQTHPRIHTRTKSVVEDDENIVIIV